MYACMHARMYLYACLTYTFLNAKSLVYHPKVTRSPVKLCRQHLLYKCGWDIWTGVQRALSRGRERHAPRNAVPMALKVCEMERISGLRVSCHTRCDYLLPLRTKFSRGLDSVYKTCNRLVSSMQECRPGWGKPPGQRLVEIPRGAVCIYLASCCIPAIPGRRPCRLSFCNDPRKAQSARTRVEFRSRMFRCSHLPRRV